MNIEERKIEIGHYLIDNPSESITDISRVFMISRSQIWKDINDLKTINIALYGRCRKILKMHKKWAYVQTKIRRN